MGEFSAASLWMRLALLFIIKGFALLLFAFATGLGTIKDVSSGYLMDVKDAEACMVIGFLCFLTAVVLALAIIFLDELKANQIALICLIVFALIAGLAVIIGLAVWGGNVTKKDANGNSQSLLSPTLLGTFSGLLGLLSGIFAILEIAGVGAK